MVFFKTKKINDHITCIMSLTGEMMYLAEGKEKAALIDTGTGIGNIRQFVNGLTSLPYDVLLTHGHMDHAAGGFLFDSVFIDPMDAELIKTGSIEERKSYADLVLKEAPPISAYVPVKEIETQPISDGELFDLGGITIEAIKVPGHTQGSVAFLFREDRIILTGDACNTFTFLFLPESLSIEEYRQSLQRLLDRAKDYDRVLLSHGTPEVQKEIIQGVYDCCTDIMTGNVDDVPFEFMGKKALIAKKTGEDRSRLDGKTGNIVYNKDRVFKTENRG